MALTINIIYFMTLFQLQKGNKLWMNYVVAYLKEQSRISLRENKWGGFRI
jgi:hypothetical protein